MNEKIIKFAKQQGFCCMWAFLEANRQTLTSQLHAQIREADLKVTARAIRYQRRAYRRGQIQCEKLSSCLAAKIGLTPDARQPPDLPCFDERPRKSHAPDET